MMINPPGKLKPSQTVKKWQIAIVATMLVFYTFHVLFILNTETFCNHIGDDFCAYWSAGRIMNKHSIADIYDPVRVAQFQEDLYTPPSDLSSTFQPVETPYLPIFLLPFLIFSEIEIQSSFIIWSLINLISFLLYLKFFLNFYADKEGLWLAALMAVLCFPFFLNLSSGQLNVWLMICVGEFLRRFLSNKKLISGLWLGGLLLKPQILILILPFLLFRREFRAIAGFAISGIVVLVSSIVLVGVDGLLVLMNILLESASGGANSIPTIMINWRMLGNNLGLFTTPLIGWVIIISGTLLTSAFSLFVFSKQPPKDESTQSIALLGVFAATCVVTWHAHRYLTLILLPPMLHLLIKEQINYKLFTGWVFVPVFWQIMIYLIGALIVYNLLPTNMQDIITYTKGLPYFLLNLLILAWSALKFLEVSEVLNKNRLGKGKNE